MLDLDDPKWTHLTGGYGIAIDIRPVLRRLEVDPDPDEAWKALWTELYHQGDIGVASFVGVPHLVRIHRQRGAVDWNTYALAATIELARDGKQNPEPPEWARRDFDSALRELAAMGLVELPRAPTSEAVRSILSVVALAYRERAHARVLLEFDAEELREIVEMYESG